MIQQLTESVMPSGGTMRKVFGLAVAGVLAAGCASTVPQPREPSAGHLSAETQTPDKEAIPSVVQQTPFLPPPEIEPEPDLERYTVVVNEVPAKELLFALARDASVNVDIHPDIEGFVTINAIDQTLPQILDRLARQVDMRYELKQGTLIVMPDKPYFRQYSVDYVNLARDLTSKNTVRAEVATTSSDIEGGGGGGGNVSSTDVTSVSNNHFWSTLTYNILAILGEAQGRGGSGDIPVTDSVIPNPESGIIAIRATSHQHEKIQQFIDSVLVNARRQVLIEATVVEVTLTDTYQAGVDWAFLSSTITTDAAGNRTLDAGSSGFDISQTVIGGFTGGAPFFSGTFMDSSGDGIAVTVRALDRFGDVKVLSSPRLMVLNNQVALLKVVDNVVYFSVDAELVQGVLGAQPIESFDTEAHTVPVGFIMMVTPQINENSVVTMNVRPTISTISQFVNDPNPRLADAGVQNPVPEISVREMESVLRVNSGHIAILGGLMVDNISKDTSGVPILSRIPGLGDAFKFRDNLFEKSELVIFIRPVVVDDPSLDGDLVDYKPYLRNGSDINPQSVHEPLQ